MNLRAIFSLISSLGGVQRFSGMKLCHKENVLEHIGTVAIIAYALVEQCRQNGYDVTYSFMANVLTGAIVHDLDESFTGDVTRPIKYFSDTMRAEFKRAEKVAIDNLQEALEIKNLGTDYDTAKMPNDDAGTIVVFADLLGAVHRVWEEVFVYRNSIMIAPAVGMRNSVENLMSTRLMQVDPSIRQTLSPIYERVLAMLDDVAAQHNPLEVLHHANRNS